MSIVSKNIIPTCNLSMKNMEDLRKDQISYAKRGLRRCGFLLGDITDKNLTEDVILKGLKHLWLGKPEKSLWKVVVFGNEMWACDFRVSFQSFMDHAGDNDGNETQLTTPHCLFCREIIDTNKPAGYHIYKQKCVVKWINHQFENQENGY